MKQIGKIYVARGSTLCDWIENSCLYGDSNPYYVILVPREPTYTLPEVAYEKARKRYCRMVDNPPSRTTENSGADEVIFDRLPLQPQVYDK